MENVKSPPACLTPRMRLDLSSLAQSCYKPCSTDILWAFHTPFLNHVQGVHLSLCKCLLSKCYARVALRAEGTTGNRTVSAERVKLGKKKMLLSPCAESLISPRSVSTAAASQDQARRSLDNKPLRPRKPI